ncbi:MAG: hypothetical protein EA361_17860 [Bacteroidetes bacterium]|nr:MAG: hypothetical protein EA361_17860 [Bacteroidota bacterium]
MNKNFVIFLILFFLSSTYNVLIAQENMILTFNTDLGNGTTVTLPLRGNVDVTVDWGDGTTPQSITTSGNLDYTYAAGGVYTVSISGSLTHFGSWSNYNNAEKLISCTSFGDLGITSLFGAFHGAVNLSEVPGAIPSTVSDLSNMFRGA